jgi:nucleoside-diphosphate-sugar epimerase
LPARIAIAGFGPVGRALAPLLAARENAVRIVQRRSLRPVPPGCSFFSADLEDQAQAAGACSDVDTVVCCVGVVYVSSIYSRLWPVIMRNLLNGCDRSGARFVFADSLYMYGPQTGRLTEDMPLTTFGRKPRVRAEITRLWGEAHAAGRVRAVAVRASDFYGPDVSTSVISIQGVARLLAGKSALVPYPADNPHDFTYVPDFARALVSLIDAPDDAYGQAWHVPNAPTKSLREILLLAAKLAGVRPRVATLPSALAPIMGLFVKDIRELEEMRFQWDRPYLVDTSKFAARVWRDATPFEQGLEETVQWYRANPR